MIRYVVDASVAIKWFFQSAADENDLEPALGLLRASRDEDVLFYQPPHFIAEVAAVLARKKPDEAQEDLRDLLDTDWRCVESTAVYLTACDLAVHLNHHVFDTLYHAVALLTPEATLVTADRRYFDKAQSLGRIMLLSNLALPHPP